MSRQALDNEYSNIGPVSGSRPIGEPSGLALEKSLSRLEPPRHRLVPVERLDNVRVERSETVTVERSDLDGGGQSETVRIERVETVFDKQSDSVRIERSETVRVERVHSAAYGNIPPLSEGTSPDHAGSTERAHRILDESVAETEPSHVEQHTPGRREDALSQEVSLPEPDRPPPRPARHRSTNEDVVGRTTAIGAARPAAEQGAVRRPGPERQQSGQVEVPDRVYDPPTHKKRSAAALGEGSAPLARTAVNEPGSDRSSRSDPELSESRLWDLPAATPKRTSLLDDIGPLSSDSGPADLVDTTGPVDLVDGLVGTINTASPSDLNGASLRPQHSSRFEAIRGPQGSGQLNQAVESPKFDGEAHPLANASPLSSTRPHRPSTGPLPTMDSNRSQRRGPTRHNQAQTLPLPKRGLGGGAVLHRGQRRNLPPPVSNAPAVKAPENQGGVELTPSDWMGGPAAGTQAQVEAAMPDRKAATASASPYGQFSDIGEPTSEPIGEYQNLFNERLEDPLGFFEPSAEFGTVSAQSSPRTKPTQSLRAAQPRNFGSEPRYFDETGLADDHDDHNGHDGHDDPVDFDDSAVYDQPKQTSVRAATRASRHDLRLERSRSSQRQKARPERFRSAGRQNLQSRHDRHSSRAPRRPARVRYDDNLEEYRDDAPHNDAERYGVGRRSASNLSQRGRGMIGSRIATVLVAVVVVVVVGLSARFAFSSPAAPEGEVVESQDVYWWVNSTATSRSSIAETCALSLQGRGVATKSVSYAEIERIERNDIPCEDILDPQN